jgi:tetratricopeptide (TPR) repeat protein
VRIEPPFGPAHWLCAEFLDATSEELEPWSRAYARQEEIEGLFRTAIELDPDDPLAHYNYGLHLWQEERDDEALDEMRTAAELGSDRAVSWLAENTMSGAYRAVRRSPEKGEPELP